MPDFNLLTSVGICSLFFLFLFLYIIFLIRFWFCMCSLYLDLGNTFLCNISNVCLCVCLHACEKENACERALKITQNNQIMLLQNLNGHKTQLLCFSWSSSDISSTVTNALFDLHKQGHCQKMNVQLCCPQQFDWLITYIALFSALLSRRTALACGSTWVSSFL